MLRIQRLPALSCLAFLCCSPGSAYAKDAVETMTGSGAMPEQSVLQCKVEAGFGFFDAYSVAPRVGDKCTIDVKKLLDEKDITIKFQPGSKAPGTVYIPLTGPFTMSNFSGQSGAYRLSSIQGEGPLARSCKIDVRRQGEVSTIFLVYEVGGITSGVMAMSGASVGKPTK